MQRQRAFLIFRGLGVGLPRDRDLKIVSLLGERPLRGAGEMLVDRLRASVGALDRHVAIRAVERRDEAVFGLRAVRFRDASGQRGQQSLVEDR